jgi:hypothetical protein
MSDSVPERIPATQFAFSGRPPGPSKIVGRGLEDSSPGDPGKTVYVLDQMVVRDLASAIGVKPFNLKNAPLRASFDSFCGKARHFS